MILYDYLSNRGAILCALLLSSVGVLSGCSLVTIAYHPPVPSITIAGTIRGGQRPITGANVQLWAVGSTGYGSASTLLGSVASDTSGQFSVSAAIDTCPQADTPIYITSTGGDPGVGSDNSAIAMAAPAGTCSDAPSSSITINEVTTVATALAYAQFFPVLDGTAASDSIGAPTTGSGTLIYPVGLLNAFSTANTLVAFDTGTTPGSVRNAAVEVDKINHLANILAACINTSSPNSTACTTLFAATTPGSGIVPTDTLQAAVSIATHPSAGVDALYGLPAFDAPFQPSLTAKPTDWTVAVNYTVPGKPASYNMAADSRGNVWFATTGTPGLYQITPGGTINGPYLASYLKDPTGIAIDTGNNVYVTDDVAGKVLEYSAGGVQSVLASSGDAYSAPIIDGKNNLYVVDANSVASVTQIVTSLGSVPNTLLSDLPTHANTTSLAVDSTGDFFITDINDTYIETFEEVPNTTLVAGVPVLAGYTELYLAYSFGWASPWSTALDHASASFTPIPGVNSIAVAGWGPEYSSGGLDQPAAVAVDGAGLVWASNASNNANASGLYSVSAIAPHGVGISPGTGFQHAGLAVPAGITLDGSGNVWVANTTAPTLTEIVGAATPVVTPMAQALANDKVGVTP